jgi:sugar/nucleoside kinase (ribokinase family)
MFDCLVAGDVCLDLLIEGVIHLEVGKEKLASKLNLVLGGSSAITAFNLSRLGAKVAFVSVIGPDHFGRFVKDKLKSGGVDVSGLRETADEQTGLTIWHSLKDQRAAVTYSGTIAMLAASDISEVRLRSARHLHMGSYFLQDSFHPDAPAVFALAKKLGLTTSLDTNYDPSERWDSNLRALLQHIDVFLPNEQEALRITGKHDVPSAARELCTLARTVVVKRGGEGALITTADSQFSIPAIPTKVVDSTGAGDSFNAGFLSQFVKRADLERCARAGISAGARSVREIGGTAAFEKDSGNN